MLVTECGGKTGWRGLWFAGLKVYGLREDWEMEGQKTARRYTMFGAPGYRKRTKI
jgi:hypothetical protein